MTYETTTLICSAEHPCSAVVPADTDISAFVDFVIVAVVIVSLVAIVFDWHRSAPARRLDRLVRKSKGRW